MFSQFFLSFDFVRHNNRHLMLVVVDIIDFHVNLDDQLCCCSFTRLDILTMVFLVLFVWLHALRKKLLSNMVRQTWHFEDGKWG